MWNERLVHEISQAYAAGSAERNPMDTWYQGEATNYQGDVARDVRLNYCLSMVKVPCVSIYVMRLGNNLNIEHCFGHWHIFHTMAHHARRRHRNRHKGFDWRCVEAHGFPTTMAVVSDFCDRRHRPRTKAATDFRITVLEKEKSIHMGHSNDDRTRKEVVYVTRVVAGIWHVVHPCDSMARTRVQQSTTRNDKVAYEGTAPPTSSPLLVFVL
jgi:hypothetical protein